MKIRIGTRDSKLAVIQAEIIAKLLKSNNSLIETELVLMKTKGDILYNRPIDSPGGGKGLFTRELDLALCEKRVDLVVHSLKDLPVELHPEIYIAVFCAEDDPRDAFILPPGVTEFDKKKPIGCSALRRRFQVEELFPDAKTALVRGNVPTRLEKLDSGEYGALVLAVAGLKRLGLENRISRIFDPNEMLCSAGQGILAVTARRNTEEALVNLLDAIDDKRTRRRALAERSFTRTLGAACGLPVAVNAYENESDNSFTISGLFYPDGANDVSENRRRFAETIHGTPNEAEDLANILACRLLVKSAIDKNMLGSVTLVGAGPGDVGLLTLSGDSHLANADVVVFDRLIGQGVLSRISPSAEKISVGKESSKHILKQNEINILLVRHAVNGKRVVRLKGGDSFVFGRGAEEALFLARAGIPCSIVPGVTSAIAVPENAGIPVTHRGISSHLHIIAAHGEYKRNIDYRALVSCGGTFTFLMGVSAIDEICDSLREAGMSGKTPCAVIESGTSSRERYIISTIDEIASSEYKKTITAPAIIIVGEVCNLGKHINIAEKKPLLGMKIALTRPRGKNTVLGSALASAGAEVVELPVIRIVKRNNLPELDYILLNRLHERFWFAFTSAHGVQLFFEHLRSLKIDIRKLSESRFAAVGPFTHAALEAHGISADLVSSKASSAVLGKELAEVCSSDAVIVLPRSSAALDDIVLPLSAKSLHIIDIPLYDPMPETGYENDTFRACISRQLDCFIFASASAVNFAVELFGKAAITRALCVGETTRQAALAHGLETLSASSLDAEDIISLLINA